MKKTLFAIASFMMLGFASCEKDSDKKIPVEDYPSAIIGFWEIEEYLEDGVPDDVPDGYRTVLQFSENDRYTLYDNSDFFAYGPDGKYCTSQKVSSFGSATYWVYQDKLFDKRASDWDCWEFGNPNCECNRTGDSHVTKIIELTRSKLVLETYIKRTYDDEVTEGIIRIESKRIEKLN